MQREHWSRFLEVRHLVFLLEKITGRRSVRTRAVWRSSSLEVRVVDDQSLFQLLQTIGLCQSSHSLFIHPPGSCELKSDILARFLISRVQHLARHYWLLPQFCWNNPQCGISVSCQKLPTFCLCLTVDESLRVLQNLVHHTC